MNGTTSKIASFKSDDVRWPLYAVLPCAILFFWGGYFFVWPQMAQRCARKYYENMDHVGRMCFHANIGSCFHSYAVVLLLLIMIASDSAISAPGNRLHRYYNPIGYVTMCVTIGYFSLSLPWNVFVLCKLKRTDVVPKPMLLHHVLVICGALIYVLGGVCAFYGAVAFACMELTNLFFIPRVLAETVGWRMDGPLCTVNGVCLVLTFVVFRVGVCTGMAVLFTSDLVHFNPLHNAEWEWALVLSAYSIFLAVLVLSWIWLRRVLHELKDGVRVLLHQRRALKVQRKASAINAESLGGEMASTHAPAQQLSTAIKESAASQRVIDLDASPAASAVHVHDPSRDDNQGTSAIGTLRTGSSYCRPLPVHHMPHGGRSVQLDPLPTALGVDAMLPPRKSKLVGGRGATVAPA